MTPILQFGTSRFLQAHADLFISEALARGEAIGSVTVVQTTDSPESARRVAAFTEAGGYPVIVRGRQSGAVINAEQRITSVTQALQAKRDWPSIRAGVASQVKVILSNTGDRGYQLSADDHVGLLESDTPPVSFPAKLLVLLYARFKAGAEPLTLYPCELVVNNGDVLQALVVTMARDWELPEAFIDYLNTQCIWVNSLVDRIVSEAIEPIGAVAEPYALWAIEAKPGMTLPCTHPNIVVTEHLVKYEQLKLWLLNLGHSYLAERWINDGRPKDETVVQAMSDPQLLADLEQVWLEEVIPVFASLNYEAEALEYLTQVKERFNNPFLAHRIADIAQNHDEKKRRRFLPVIALAQEKQLPIAQAQLRRAVAGLSSTA
jgi:tagaturonate reductase